MPYSHSRDKKLPDTGNLHVYIEILQTIGHTENLLLSKSLSLSPDLVIYVKPTGKGQRTGQCNWEPGPLGQ